MIYPRSPNRRASQWCEKIMDSGEEEYVPANLSQHYVRTRERIRGGARYLRLDGPRLCALHNFLLPNGP